MRDAGVAAHPCNVPCHMVRMLVVSSCRPRNAKNAKRMLAAASPRAAPARNACAAAPLGWRLLLLRHHDCLPAESPLQHDRLAAGLPPKH